MSFDGLFAPIECEYRRRAEGHLAELAEARDVGRAWRAWRRLEQGWDALGPEDRGGVKDLARRRLPSAPDGERRLAVVERLPD